MDALQLSAREARWLELARDPQADAERVELVYVTEGGAGLRRRRCGKGFTYQDERGRTIRDAAVRERCQRLAIPPAWQDVWICPDARGHLQATGRDERGRKQYLYHPTWQRVRAETKFNRMLPFGRALPLLRAATRRAMRGAEPDHERVIAAVVALLDRTFLRIGNEEYATSNDSYGLTTLREHHVALVELDDGESQISLDFRAKGGFQRVVELEDRRVAEVVRDCHELPGQRLFKYVGEDGEVRPVTSSDVNEWLRRVTGCSFSAKDFRTWGGCVYAGELLAARPDPQTKRETQSAVREVLEHVALRLGNTATVCRKYYVHPRLIESFEAGQLADLWQPDDEDEEEDLLDSPYDPDELNLMGFLRRITSRSPRTH